MGMARAPGTEQRSQTYAPNITDRSSAVNAFLCISLDVGVSR